MIQYLAWAIPSIGFIGTVVGIGDAMAKSDQMIQSNPNEQRDAIQNVTNLLGTAFDTTLVSLLLSVVLMLLIHRLRRSQEKVVLGFSDDIRTRVFPFLRFSGSTK